MTVAARHGRAEPAARHERASPSARCATKRAQLDDPATIGLYQDLLATVDWSPDDPRVPALADKLAALLDDFTHWEAENEHQELDEPNDKLDDELVEVLDSIFYDALPIAPRLLDLLEERGWSGWTRLKRTTPH